MIEAQCSVQITFPVELKGPNVVCGIMGFFVTLTHNLF